MLPAPGCSLSPVQASARLEGKPVDGGVCSLSLSIKFENRNYTDFYSIGIRLRGSFNSVFETSLRATPVVVALGSHLD